MTDTPKTHSRKSPAWMRVVLVASLAINLLVIGAILGSLGFGGRHRDHVERIRGARELAPPPFVIALEQDDRRALIARHQSETRGFRRDRGETRAVLSEFLSALRAEEFDAESVRNMLGDELERQRSRQEIGSDLFLDHLARMSSEERRAYADRLERTLKRRR